MRIEKSSKPATPWNATLARLKVIERSIGDREQEAMLARWQFGHELLPRRVTYKGRLVVPSDLMKLAKVECGLTQNEINSRIRFAERYPSKKEMFDAVKHFGSWHRMTHEGLVEKKQAAPRKSHTRSAGQVIRKLAKELDVAFTHHAVLTRDDVKAIEQLQTTIDALLKRLDLNDERKAS